MKKQEIEYFMIEKGHLKSGKLFPFNLYLFNPLSRQFTPFLFGNSPLTNEKSDLLNYILERGGSLAIAKKQKRTFLAHIELKEEEIPHLAKMAQDKTEDETDSKSQDTQKAEEEIKPDYVPPLNLTFELEKSLSEDNFMNLIERAREEIYLFPRNISHTVSLAGYMANRILNEDNITSRICAVSYFFAKNCDIKSISALADLVCASMFHHIGHTQIDHTFVVKNQLELADDNRKTYRQHAGLSQHLLKKCGVDLSDRCLKIILEHHERYDGRGYPNSKMGAHIEQMALILGAISHIFEYASGRITGTPTPIKTIVHNIKNKTFTPGLEVEFGETIYNGLSYLVQTEKNKMAA